jgi:hypothetical protein
MNKNRKYTAYCGLWCKDCIPSHSELFTLAAKFAEMLDALGFEHYAKFKSASVGELKNYDKFRKLLGEMGKLKCKTNCFEGPVSECGCNADCPMRQCVLEKNIAGCWECSSYKVCEKLEPHKKFHPSMEHNLDMIKKYGLDKWLDKKGKHYQWDK